MAPAHNLRLRRKGRLKMIEDKATEKWKERAKKLGLIVNMGADKPKSKSKAGGTKGEVRLRPGKKGKK
jgi:hypothetical protein